MRTKEQIESDLIMTRAQLYLLQQQEAALMNQLLIYDDDHTHESVTPIDTEKTNGQ